ncbi:MAG: sigma-70 family RNA polymerase sigma factor [Bacteroidota bacterium]
MKEEEIAESIINGSGRQKRKAISFLYKSCFPGLKSWILQSGTEAEAEDIFQEGLSRLYDSLYYRKFNFESKITTYLHTICKNLWLMEQRRKKVLFNSDLLEDSSELPQPMIDQEIINPLLQELGENCQKLLEAYYYENKSMAKIQTEFNLGSEQAARNKKYRCLKRLIGIINEKGLNYESFIK